jgi:hypothetical protein
LNIALRNCPDNFVIIVAADIDLPLSGRVGVHSFDESGIFFAWTALIRGP